MRAPRGERAVVLEPFETGGNIPVIGALTLDGVRAPMMIEGAIDGQVLELYVQHFLVPQLRPGDIVIWDNVPTHKSANVLALIEVTGGRGWNHCPPTRPTSIRRKDAFPRSNRN
jgi:transposase